MRHFSLVLYRPFLFVPIRVTFYVIPFFYVFLYFSKAILLGATSKFQWGLAFIRESILVMMMKTKRTWFHFILCSAVFLLLPSLAVGSGYPAPGKGCLSAKCHADIESIRNRDSEMLNQIFKKGELLGNPNGCVICHGGNPFETEKKDNAHRGAPQGGTLDVYVPFPGSMWINHKTCGQCHPKHVYAMHRSVMNTEAGKIQGAMWGWGASTGYKHLYGNYDLKDLDGPVPVFGTETYSNYIQKYMKSFPDIFPLSLRQVPEANLLTLSEKPEQAIFTYIRSDCQRCHVGVRGRDKRGDFRGMGCAACHIPYSNEGLYEGTDKSIPKEKAGHLLVHTIQATRKAKVTVNGKTYSGIPHETCASCHNRGKRIGVSYQGLMEFPYGTPFNAEGGKQPKLHTKRYLYIQDDHHHSPKNREENPEGGLLCQDCHTTTAFHGNGNIATTTLASVDIECSDCHGTPDKYPWELPIGFGDEFGKDLDSNTPRGLAAAPMVIQKEFATFYPAKKGYLLNTRGNPFGNVIHDGNKVIIYSASGLDFEVPTLKSINTKNAWKNPQKAKTAMIGVTKHLKTMECYACHSAWAPQCYGCHVKIDYSGGKESIDWVKSGNTRLADGQTGESKRDGNAPKQPGKTSEARTYLRWENPVLGINGEGRVSPIIPGCQQITTVIGPDGKTLVNNKIWRTPPGLEGGGEEGQRGIDMTPAAPHTSVREARPCVSCHASSKTLGYGTYGGRYMNQFIRDVYVDMTTAEGNPLSRNAVVQIAAIPDLPMDLDQVVTRNGKQVQTVGHHWPASRPLNQKQRDNMERIGVCLACHQDIPDGTSSMKMLHQILKKRGRIPTTDEKHKALIRSLNRDASDLFDRAHVLP